MPSLAGGRWAPAAREDGSAVPVLYTSFERDGALAEVSSYLALLTPPPTRPLTASLLSVNLSRVVRLDWADLVALGVDRNRFEERRYDRGQAIGAAAAAIGVEGLIVPSARWACENLVIYTENLSGGSRLEVEGAEQVDWQVFAREHGLL